MWVMDNNGLNYYLDVDGQQLLFSKYYVVWVWIVIGFILFYEVDFRIKLEYLLNQVYELNELLWVDLFLDVLIEQIYLNKCGEMILSFKVGKQIILMGCFYNIEDKL